MSACKSRLCALAWRRAAIVDFELSCKQICPTGQACQRHYNATLVPGSATQKTVFKGFEKLYAVDFSAGTSLTAGT